MRVLLDTNALLRIAYNPAALSYTAAVAYRDADAVYHSVVNYWEIGLKMARGGFSDITLPPDWDQRLPHGCEEQGFQLLQIQVRHCRRIQDLPFRHKDPFDRMLVAQAQEEQLAIISSDEIFDTYGVKRLW
jgi:PIN domain nuclease of toxin-antitoxin system